MKSSPYLARGQASALQWREIVADGAHLTPVEFLAAATEAVREPCTLAQVLETCAHHAAPGDQETAGILEKYLGTRPQNWVVASAAIRGLGYVGGARAESSLGMHLGEVRSERERIDARIEALKEKHAKLPVRMLRQRSHLVRLEEAIEAAQNTAHLRLEPVDGFTLIAGRLLALRDSSNPLPVLRKLNSRNRRVMTQRRKTAADGLLAQLVRTLDPIQHREALTLLVREGGLKGFGFAALESLSATLNDEEFVSLVREPWLASSLRGYDRARLQKMLEGRGSLGAQLIEEAFELTRRAAIKSQLLPSVIKDQPLSQQWSTLEAIYRDPDAAPKLKEAVLRQIRALMLPQGAELFLEICRDPRSTRSQANIASSALRELGTTIFMRVLVEEGALGRAANSAKSRKVQRRLSLLRRQLGDAELKEAFPEAVKARKSSTASESRDSCSKGERLHTGFTGRCIIPVSSNRSERKSKQSIRAFQPPTCGPKAQTWRLVLTNRRTVAASVKYDPPRAAATKVRSYARNSIALLPVDRHRDSAIAVEAFERVSASIGNQRERICLGLAVGAVAEKLRHMPEAAFAWN